MEPQDIPNTMVEICIGYAGAVGMEAMVEITEVYEHVSQIGSLPIFRQSNSSCIRLIL